MLAYIHNIHANADMHGMYTLKGMHQDTQQHAHVHSCTQMQAILRRH